MNRQEAYSIVTTVLERYLAMDFDDVLSRIGTTASEEFLASSSVRYAIEVSVSWADSGHRAVLITARIDDQNAFHYELIEERICVRNPHPEATRSDDG